MIRLSSFYIYFTIYKSISDLKKLGHTLLQDEKHIISEKLDLIIFNVTTFIANECKCFKNPLAKIGIFLIYSTHQLLYRLVWV